MKDKIVNIPNEVMEQAEKKFEQMGPLQKGAFPDYPEWVLLVDVDFFGTMIYAGTVFRQVNSDYYHPIINGARCPSYQIDFMIVKNNPKVFLKLNR